MNKIKEGILLQKKKGFTSMSTWSEWSLVYLENLIGYISTVSIVRVEFRLFPRFTSYSVGTINFFF